ncbi:MAG: hypothetical protein WAV84_00960 [Bacteroidota bacterium]
MVFFIATLVMIFGAVVIEVNKASGMYIMLGIAMALFILSILLGGSRSIETGFIWMIGWFAIGYNSYPIEGILRIHGLDVIAMMLVFYYMFRGNRYFGSVHSNEFRVFTVFLLLISVYGAVIAALGGIPWFIIVNEMKNYMLGIPVFYFLPGLLSKEGFLKKFMRAMIFAGLLIAIPGIIDFHLGYFSAGSIWGDGFDRALFPIWGTPMAVLVLTLCYQSHFALLGEVRRRSAKLQLYFSIGIHLYAIYLSGTRNMWLAVLLSLCYMVYLRFGVWRGAIVLAIVVALFSLLPEAAESRMTSFYMLHEGEGVITAKAYDSSGAKREARMEVAWAQLSDVPLGGGWGYAGWVHSDFLQLAVNVGIIPGLIFLLFYLRVAIRILWTARRKSEKELGLWSTLSGYAITIFLLLAFGGVSQLIQYMMPVWVCLALLAAMLQRERAEAGALAKPLRPRLHLPVSMQDSDLEVDGTL